ncbi:MAG: 50S ribosomal protein L4 [Candidatus Marinimicrobia bacterium]|nr:50S ribosomal protein L4 [Candidatus Neomarinimicrobiota bacterium]
MKVDLYNISGSKTSKKADLNDKVFKIKPNQHSIYLAIKSELASRRQGTSSSKTRSEVRGGGAKPWKQKGTGRARIGSTRNPSRVHGGAAFGPRPHKYSVKVNKKVKVLAKKSALSIKIAADEYKILDKFSIDSHKTKDFVSVLKKLDLHDMKITLITNEKNDNLFLSSKNLEKINLVNAQSFSTYDVMNSNYILVDQSSVEYLNNLN